VDSPIGEKLGLKTYKDKESKVEPFPVVGIGASAGGLEALRELFDALPPNTGMAFVLILHLSPEHKSQLAEILTKNTLMPVVEASDNLHMKPNHVYVIPPNAGISISDGSLTLETINRKDGPPLPIDRFLTSLAEHRKETAVGVLLSGTGSDGTKGLQEIKAEGGYTFAQKPETARFHEMPQNAIVKGVVDYVLTIEEMAAKLSEVSKKIGARKPQTTDQAEAFDANPLSKIMSTLKARTGIDFIHYKRTTISRRINRRMILRNTENIDDYAKLINEDPAEADELYNDILINVTSFFRDPEVYEALSKEVWPKIMRERPPSKAVRIWVPACSSGEEVYSIAISFLEYLGDRTCEVQLFGTDIDEQAIKKARLAFYPEDIREHVSQERLNRFFFQSPGKGYQVRKDIRDRCIFARHNVLTDPPFMNVDLVSCRNLMIYLDNHLQDRVIPIFHYALNKEGFLILGKSETLGKYGDLFYTVDKSNRIYSKKPANAGEIYSSLVFQPTELKEVGTQSKPSRSDYGELLSSLHREVERIVESSYAPAGVVVSDELEVIEFRGTTGAFLEHSSGAASLNITKMVKGSLSFELRLALEKARQTNRSVRVEGVSMAGKEGGQKVDLEVVPFTIPKQSSRFFLILFEMSMRRAAPKAKDQARGPARDARQQELDQLQRELGETKAQMQSYMEEQEATKEELRSANEELRVSYEELQSINEELQSSREEIQASNEELRTVNDELADKNKEINSLYSDLNNFVNSTKIAMIMVDNDLRIRRITPMIERVMNVLPSDIGRPISDLKLSVNIPNLESQIRESVNGLRAMRTDVKSSAGTWYSMRIEPYRTIDNRIDGAVITFIDVNELLQEKKTLAEHSAELEIQADVSAKEIEETNMRLLEAENAEVIGKLTAVLAHDLRNPLNFISQASELARKQPEKADRMLQLIGENAGRSLMMIEELRTSTIKINLQQTGTDLASLIRSVAEESRVPETIKLEVVIGEGLGKTSLDAGHMRRVLDNLVSNAIEAMPNGGRLTIRARRVEESIVIEVEDTGTGILEEAIPRIFESFYTSKAKGLGLGLVYSKRAVEAHGGSITFRTAQGSGTTFTILLPQSPK
jgi:two-component system CheB/CheR fusion protein